MQVHLLVSRRFAVLAFVLLSMSTGILAQSSPDVICPRFNLGSVVHAPSELSSVNGVLDVTFHFQSVVDRQGLRRYCYITPDGLQAPTLRVNPGDWLIIHLHNDLPVSNAGNQMGNMVMSSADSACHGAMGPNVTNLHFHGMDIPPICHQDEVLHTLVQPSENFEYRIQIPKDEPPGMYWYHPHPHGDVEKQVQGGASGVLIVEGIENANPSVIGLPERVLVLRDQPLVTAQGEVVADDDSQPRPLNTTQPTWDISINYVSVTYATNLPARILTGPGEKEFWRVLNASADTIFDLQLIVDNMPQHIEVVAIDGVPLPRPKEGQSRTETSIPILPGARAEFIVTSPKPGDHAELITRAWDAGPDGDVDPERVIASVVSQHTAAVDLPRVTAQPAPRKLLSSSLINTETMVRTRKLYFSESRTSAKNPDKSTKFFLTFEGQKPAAFSMSGPPSVVVREGTVEDWIIENRAREDHVFHTHQIHFQVLETNGRPANDSRLRDTIDVPYWDGKTAYPSVKLRMDFRDSNIVGTFVFHCHILEHEDGGMMGSVQVLPRDGSASHPYLSAPQ